MPLKTVRTIPRLPPRRREAHKGDFGRILIIAGSTGMVGAPALVANAALRSGAGLVRIACPRPAQQTIAGLAPCATSFPLDATATGQIAARAQPMLMRLIAQHDVIAVGPGLGQSPVLRKFLATLVATPDKPMVIDADGLNNLAATNQWWTRRRANLVLTPHPGEMKRLLITAGQQDEIKDRKTTAADYAALTGTIVVLKGAGTVVTDGSKVYINKTGNPGMATPGTGDVLTGILAALIAQNMPPLDAAIKAVHVHGKAADIAARQIGQISLIATDLINTLPTAFRK